MAPVRNAGAVFDAPTAPAASTVSVKLVVPDSGGVPSSVAVTVILTVAGASVAPGVPEKVRELAVNFSQAGRLPPSVGAAEYVSVWFSASTAAGTA